MLTTDGPKFGTIEVYHQEWVFERAGEARENEARAKQSLSPTRPIPPLQQLVPLYKQKRIGLLFKLYWADFVSLLNP